jgi:hypothetical protein
MGASGTHSSGIKSHWSRFAVTLWHRPRCPATILFRRDDRQKPAVRFNSRTRTRRDERCGTCPVLLAIGVSVCVFLVAWWLVKKLITLELLRACSKDRGRVA